MQNSFPNKEKTNQPALWSILILFFANFFIWSIAAGNLGKKYLEVTFFDVGQGDAAFIQSPAGRQILIDGGPNNKVLEQLGQAMPFWDKDIDLVILTHPDRDHVAGLFNVLKNYQVKQIIWSGVAAPSPESKEWLSLIASQPEVEIASPKEKIQFDNNQNNYIEILSPGSLTASAQNKNEGSVVARLVYGQRSFLFAGDITAQEGDALESGGNLRADVLKVAHHGSKYSTSDKFLANLLPAVAVISVGAGNSYGHPTPEVLELLSKYAITTLRTDKNGNISFRTDGEHIFLKTQK